MASNLVNRNGLQPYSNGLKPNSDGPQPNVDGLQPNSNGLLHDLQPRDGEGSCPAPVFHGGFSELATFGFTSLAIQMLQCAPSTILDDMCVCVCVFLLDKASSANNQFATCK